MRRLAVPVMLALLHPALVPASEDEAWLRRAPLPASTVPLLALVVDTSEAMAAEVDVLPPYDPARDYTAEAGSACRRDRVYWRLGSGPPPDCDGSQWISLGAATAARGWRCEAGTTSLESVGVFIATRAAQWEPRGTGGYWRALEPGTDGAVECMADRGGHGASAGPWYAADGEAGPWRNAPDAEPDWQATPLSAAYVFFTGNYLAYLSSTERIRISRYDWLVRRITEGARAAGQLDIALVRFSHDGLGGDDDARGGMVALAPTRLPDGAATVALAAGRMAPWRTGPGRRDARRGDPLARRRQRVLRRDLAARPGRPLPQRRRLALFQRPGALPDTLRTRLPTGTDRHRHGGSGGRGCGRKRCGA